MGCPMGQFKRQRYVMNVRNVDKANCEMINHWSRMEAGSREVRQWLLGYANSIAWGKFLYWKQQLHLPDTLETLEAGCGFGIFSMLLGLNGAQVTLLDYNARVLESALVAHRSVGLNPKAVTGDLMELSYQMEGLFDVVCSFGALEHFSGDHRRLAFESNVRFLKPGGLLFFTVPNYYAVFYRIAFGLRKKARLLPDEFYEEPYSRHEIESIALTSGIVPLEIESIGTLKNDFRYWIGENMKSVLRKLRLIEGGLADDLPDDIDINEIDLSGDMTQVRRNSLDKLFSHTLLFVGQKIQ
jgi:SAM-dependent methyltransferase